MQTSVCQIHKKAKFKFNNQTEKAAIKTSVLSVSVMKWTDKPACAQSPHSAFKTRKAVCLGTCRWCHEKWENDKFTWSECTQLLCSNTVYREYRDQRGLQLTSLLAGYSTPPVSPSTLPLLLVHTYSLTTFFLTFISLNLYLRPPSLSTTPSP